MALYEVSVGLVLKRRFQVRTVFISSFFNTVLKAEDHTAGFNLSVKLYGQLINAFGPRRSIAVLAALRQWQATDAAGLTIRIDTLGETKTSALAALARKPLRLIGWHMQIGTMAGGQLDARQAGETKRRPATKLKTDLRRSARWPTRSPAQMTICSGVSLLG